MKESYLIKDLEKIRAIFPNIEEKLLKYLKIDYVGEYSISIPYDSLIITNLVKFHIENPDPTYIPSEDQITLLNFNHDFSKYTITDATAGVGGNTISFCQNFGFVNAIEMNRKRFSYMTNNLELYRCNNMKCYNKNLLDIIFNLNQDVIFVDPPWGGKMYKANDKITLNISGIDIEELVNNVFEKTSTKIIICKLPKNYDINNLKQIKNKKRYIYRTRRMIILVVSK